MKLNLRDLAAAPDQRAAILAAVEDALPSLDILRNRVLLATYVEPEKTAGGIFMPDKRVEESRYQSKVGLILKKGPAAFKFNSAMDEANPSQEYEVGEWVFYRNADSWEIGLAGLSCRFINDEFIVGRVTDPKLIW